MEPEFNSDTNLDDYIENELKKNRPYPKKFDIAVPAYLLWRFFKNKLNNSAVTISAVKMHLISLPKNSQIHSEHNNFSVFFLTYIQLLVLLKKMRLVFKRKNAFKIIHWHNYIFTFFLN